MMAEQVTDSKSRLWPLMLIDANFDDSGLSLSARGVYVHLCRRADKAHVAWPGIDSIALTVRANKKTVIRAIKELEERGFIKVVRVSGLRSNYEILPKDSWRPLPKTDLPQESSGPKKVTRPLPKTDRPVTQKGPPPVQNEERKDNHIRITKKDNHIRITKKKDSKFFSLSSEIPEPEKRKPGSFEELLRFCETELCCVSNFVDRNDCQHYWDKMEQRGWYRDSKCKHPIKDWKANFREWATASDWLPSKCLKGEEREAHVRKFKERISRMRRMANGNAGPEEQPDGSLFLFEEQLLQIRLPDNLQTPEFCEFWEKWKRHRTEIRKPLKPTQERAQLEKFSEWGPERSMAAIWHTIAMGWQGIREPEPGWPTNWHDLKREARNEASAI
jgi:Helix-turn-helix domain